MPRRAALLWSLGCLIACAGAAAARAQEPALDDAVPAPVGGRPPDSDAPPGSPPHWLPHDMWVHLHWVPFDEARLQSVLHSSRAELWSWLRDDTQTLAQLGAQRGHPSPHELAATLVAPRAGDVSAAMLRRLRARTLRVLVQGHLSQHLIFHSLHQEAGPEAAAELFGVRDTAAFQRDRRLDLSPLRIGRAHGRTRAWMHVGLEHELRAAARAGIAGGDTSPRQAAIVLARQLRQVPRWLGEDHYNGPPQTDGGALRYPLRPSFASPALAGDGRTVLFDAQQPAPPLAVRYGEVVLEGRELATGTQIDPRDASHDALLDRPCSSYGPSLSSDGRRIAYEISAGNRTYAKRYGNVVVAVADLATRTVRVVAGGARGRRVETAYDPVLSSDGEVVAYERVVADPMSPSARAATRVRVLDLRTGATFDVPRAGAYEPAISGNGRRVAFSAFSHGRLQVFVADRRSGLTTLVSRIGRRDGAPAAEAWEPAISDDGRRVAFAATTRAGGRARVYVRDVRRVAARAVSGPGAGFASEPSISAHGQRVAYSELVRGGRRSPAGRPLQRVVVRDLAGGRVRVVSSDAGGGALAGWSSQPQISAYGTRVAFTTDAGTPGGGGPGGLRILVRDVAAGTTTLASPPAPLGAFQTGPGALQPTRGPLCGLTPPAW
jgi:Tol biopolymer transport system component